MTDNIKSIYFGGITAKRGSDGFMHVKGLATDDTLDLDQQICDPKWLAKAMPEWMEIGNIREMHQSKAVGKATEMERTGTGFVVTAKVVDEQAAKMVEEGIYTGFSVGIKGARVVKDAAAPGGRIVDGTIVEVSLVDRPANPSAVIEIAKSIDGALVKGSAVTEIIKAESPELNAEAIMTEEPGVASEVLDHDVPQPCQACAGTGKKSNVMGNTQETDCEVCNGSGHQPDGRSENIVSEKPGIPEVLDNRDMKDAEPDLAKKDYSDAERADMASSGQALPSGGFPIKTVKDLKNAIQSIGRAKNPAEAKAHIKTRAKALGREDLIPDNWKGANSSLVKEYNPDQPRDDNGRWGSGRSGGSSGPSDYQSHMDQASEHIQAGEDTGDDKQYDAAQAHSEAAHAIASGSPDAQAKSDAAWAATRAAGNPYKSVKGKINKADDTHDAGDLAQIRDGLINTIKAELDEMLAGDENEVADVEQLLCTLKMFLDWWTDEASENETQAPFTGWDDSKDDTMAYIGLGVSADLIKSASAETATPEVKDELRTEIVKALGLEEVMTAKAELSKATEEIELLKAALDEVKSMAAPGGPALRATREQTSKSASVLAKEVEAARYRALAAQITDPALRNQYLDTARVLEAN